MMADGTIHCYAQFTGQPDAAAGRLPAFPPLEQDGTAMDFCPDDVKKLFQDTVVGPFQNTHLSVRSR